MKVKRERRDQYSSPFSSSSLFVELRDEREEVLKLKWLESETQCEDIGMSRAVTHWIIRHRGEWKKHRIDSIQK